MPRDGSTLNYRKAKETLAALGLSLHHDLSLGEYRVAWRGVEDPERTAYYADDLADAVSTGQAMARGDVQCVRLSALDAWDARFGGRSGVVGG